MIRRFQLTQTIKYPTRNIPTSSTLVDINSSDGILTKDSDVDPCHHISDHHVTYITVNNALPGQNPLFTSISNIKNCSQESFNKHLQSINFEVIYDADALNDNIKLLLSLLNYAGSKSRKSKHICRYDYYNKLHNYTTPACKHEKKLISNTKFRTQGVNTIWMNLDMLNVKKRKITIWEKLKKVNDINKCYFMESQELLSIQVSFTQEYLETQISLLFLQICYWTRITGDIIRINVQGHYGINI